MAGEYIEEIVADTNDINEDTQMQMELINKAIAELQTGNKSNRLRKPIGYIQTYTNGQ